MKLLDAILARGKSACACAPALVGLFVATSLDCVAITSGSGSIYGTVYLDWTGGADPWYAESLSGRTVELIDTDSNGVIGATTTNYCGVYEFSGIPSGKYRISLGETEEYPYYISSVEYGAKDSLGNEFGAENVSCDVEFEWPDVDILPLSLIYELHNDFYVVVRLPFSFPYYGKQYDKIAITENGYLSFDFAFHEVYDGAASEQTACVDALGLGYYDADASWWSDRGWVADGCYFYSDGCWEGTSSVIAPLMTDLRSYFFDCEEDYDEYGSYDSYGQVGYGYIYNCDGEVEAFVVEWYDMELESEYGTSMTFRAYLYPDGQIRFEYDHMSNCEAFNNFYNCELGLCDSTIYGSVGLEGPYENNPLVIQNHQLYDCWSDCDSSGSSCESDNYYGCGDEASNYVRSEYAIVFRPQVKNTVEVFEEEAVELDVMVSFYAPAVIGGAVQLDSNGNGVWDYDDEYIMDEIIIYVDLNNNGERDEDEPYVLTECGEWYIGWDPYCNTGIFLPAGTYTFRQDLSYTPQYEEIPERSLVVSAINSGALFSQGLGGEIESTSSAGYLSLLHFRYPIDPYYANGFQGGYCPESYLDMTAVVNVGDIAGGDIGGLFGFQSLIWGLGNSDDGLIAGGIFEGLNQYEELETVLALARLNPFNGAMEIFSSSDEDMGSFAPLLLDAPFSYQIEIDGEPVTINFAFANDLTSLFLGLGGLGSQEQGGELPGSILVADFEGTLAGSGQVFDGVYVVGSAVDGDGNIWLSCIDVMAFDIEQAENPLLFLAQLHIDSEEQEIWIGDRYYVPPYAYSGLYDLIEYSEYMNDEFGNYNPVVILFTLFSTFMQGLAWDPVNETLMLTLTSLDIESIFYNDCLSSLSALTDIFDESFIYSWDPCDTYCDYWSNYYGCGGSWLEFADVYETGVIPSNYLPTGAEVISVTGFTVTLCSDDSFCGCGPGFVFLNKIAEQSQSSSIIYVDEASTAFDPDGSSWANAFPTLQEGLAEAQARLDELAQNPPEEPVEQIQIWVANGTYTTDSGSFTLVDGVLIYGGFDKTEFSPEDRDLGFLSVYREGDTATGTTVLQGVNGTTHVVIASNTGADTLLDGFVITGGNADVGSQTESYGGGLYGTNVNMTISNCVFTENNARYYGGAVYISGGASTIQGCVFTWNTSLFDGGAVYLDTGTHTVNASWFADNRASYDGGAMLSNQAALFLSNSVFGYNTSGRNGGAIQQNSTTNAAKSNPVTLIRNNTFYGNSVVDIRNNPTGYGGALSSDRYVKAIVENNIFWENKARLNPQIYSMAVANITVRYNTIQGNYSPSTFTKVQNPYLDEYTFEIYNPSSTAINGGNSVELYDLYGDERTAQTLGAIAFGIVPQ